MEENKNAPNPDKEEANKNIVNSQEQTKPKEQASSQENTATEQDSQNKNQNLRDILSQMNDEELASLIAKTQMADFYLDALQRMKAEYENYQKRIERERSSQIKYALQPIMNKLISILDILETAIQSGNQMESNLTDKKFFEGICLAYKEFFKLLQDFGLNKIQSMGAKFNPSYHEAVQQRESQDHPDMTVVEEIQTGYLFQDRLLRASKVIVSKKPAANKE